MFIVNFSKLSTLTEQATIPRYASITRGTDAFWAILLYFSFDAFIDFCFSTIVLKVGPNTLVLAKYLNNQVLTVLAPSQEELYQLRVKS
ncbi:hypothetical protein UT300019_22220 [Clostridium sp. CTA-19]